MKVIEAATQHRSPLLAHTHGKFIGKGRFAGRRSTINRHESRFLVVQPEDGSSQLV
jgi:hypothetical protein